MDTIGKLDRRITIQSASDVKDGYGGVTRTWGTYVDRWANIKYTRGSEGYQADRKNALYTILFTLRRDSGTKGINQKMRIKYEGMIYDIVSISERTDEYRRMYLTIEGEQKGPEDSTYPTQVPDGD